MGNTHTYTTMSQAGRKDFTDKLSEGVTPDSQKSTGEKLSEKATDAYDKVANAVEPESQKSTTQKVGDKFESDTSRPSPTSPTRRTSRRRASLTLIRPRT